MGAFQSSPDDGYKEKTDKTDISLKIDEMLTKLLDKHMSDFVDKKFCKKAKLFIKDEVLMKQAEDNIEKLQDKIIIGTFVGDADTKPEICEKLSHYFLKKLNLIASINMVIKLCNSRLDSLKSGGQCYLDYANNLSNIKYQPFFKGVNKLSYDKQKKTYSFDKKYVLHVDSNQVRQMAFDKLKADKRGRNILDKYLPKNSRDNLLYREIVDSEQCKKEGGKWLDNENDLIKNGLKPNSLVSYYNKGWNDIVNKTENYIAKDSNELFKLLNEVIHETVVDINGVKTKQYVDKIITDKRLGELIEKSKKIIYNMLSEIDKTYLLTSSIPLVSHDEIKSLEELEEEKKKLDKQLKNSKDRLKLSN
jgi:hypothetical protein